MRFGRPSVEPPDGFPAIVAQWKSGRLTFQEALECSGLSQATFYRRLKELREGRGTKK